MDPTIATGTPSTGSVHFLNLEYVFYLIYQLISGGPGAAAGGGFHLSWLVSLVTLIWITVTIVAYLISLGFLALFIYSTIRMHEVKDADAPRFATVDAHHAEEVTEHHRWNHVRELIESPHDSDWRQAIIEADIILDDMLMRLGYTGDTMAEKFRKVDPAKFHTLHDAMEAHGVRNRVAHDGAAFPLTDHLAYRTILQYENAFREHGEI